MLGVLQYWKGIQEDVIEVWRFGGEIAGVLRYC